MELRRQTSPGKFEGGLVIDELAYDLSMTGCDDEVGDAYEGDWHGRINGPFKADGPFASISAAMRTELNLTYQELAFLSSAAGCIIREDDQGFVSVAWYTDADEFNSDWADVVDSYGPEDDTDESED